MCGISAVIALDTSTSSRETCFRADLNERLERSLDEIKHRGPDARGVWISENNRVGLGHVRLSINDLDARGNQPFHAERDDIHVVVNGEFYDYRDIRSELETDYSFETSSDSEIIIALYLKYGTHLLSKLRGEFAFILYDGRKQALLAARDRYGIKPLFWTIQESQLFIASEAKAFLPLGWRPQWDVRSIVEDGWLHDERTLFKGVNKIRPGYFMSCLSFGHISHREYWDLEYPNKKLPDTRTEEEQIQGLRERLIDAVKARLQADVPIGIYLSGGIDSAIVAGIANHLVINNKNIYTNGQTNGNADRGTNGSANRSSHHTACKLQKPLACFGVGFEEGTEFDEMPLAQETAEFLKLPYISRRMDEAYLAENFESATYHSEHHNPDLNYVAKFALSEIPQKHGYKVIISGKSIVFPTEDSVKQLINFKGEGSDEHFGGYSHFLPDFLREPDLASPNNQIPDKDRETLLIQSEARLQPGYKGIDTKFTACESSLAQRMLNGTSIAAKLWTVTLAHFAPWTKIYGEINPQDMRASNPDGRTLKQVNDVWHPLHTSQYIWTKSILPNLILTCMGDRMEMGHSIEGRPPFLDHHLTEYVNALPPSSKLRWDPETGDMCAKWILREAGKPFITDRMYRRKKFPFTAPNVYPVDGPLHNLLKKCITFENVEALGFVDWSKVTGLLEDAFDNQNQTSLRFAFNLAQWVIISKKFGVEKAQCII